MENFNNDNQNDNKDVEVKEDYSSDFDYIGLDGLEKARLIVVCITIILYTIKWIEYQFAMIP